MKSKVSRHISIARHIVDGSITIDSIKEFRSILRIFPNDPALHRVYADLLARKDSPDDARESYRKAATLYIEAGMRLQAIVCKILEWRLKKPGRPETKRFFDALNGGEYHQTPMNIFFNRLAFSEFVALMNQMTRVRLTAGRTVKKIGDAENYLYLIAAGNLKSTTVYPLAGSEADPEKSAVYFRDNDFFGDIYPFEAEKISQAYVETLTRAELIKISKTRLKRICKKYPNIELGIIDLINARSQTGAEGPGRKVRLADRHKLPIKINLKIYPGKSGDHALILDGYTKDVSIGGMCIVLDAKYTSIPSMYADIKDARIQLAMPGDAMTISVLGQIVWSREVTADGQKSVALGIRYRDMTPKLSGLLVVFADILHQSA